MRARHSWGAVLAGFLLILLTGTTAWAQPPGMWGRGGHGGWHMLGLIRGVGLTEAQQAQVRQIVGSHRERFRTLSSELRAAQEALTARLYSPDQVASDDLSPLLRQIDQRRGDLSRESAQVALEVRGVLTPEQLAKAAQLHQRSASSARRRANC